MGRYRPSYVSHCEYYARLGPADSGTGTDLPTRLHMLCFASTKADRRSIVRRYILCYSFCRILHNFPSFVRLDAVGN